MNPALRASAAHVFVESLHDPVLSADDDHHLRRVLRLRVEETISLSDGAGRWATAALGDGHLRVTSEINEVAATRSVTIAASIPKGDRLEWMVQKLTELGVDSIVLVECERSVVRLRAEREAKQLDRLARIAREAAMQSRRVRLPSIATATFADVAGLPAVALAEPGGGVLPDSVDTILIGPEGGFTDAELAVAAPRVALSPTILRVETAAMVAAVAMTSRTR